MKIKSVFLILFLVLQLVASCNDDDNDYSSKAEIIVYENSNPKAGVAVHMFPSHQGPGSTFYRPQNSKREVVTNNNGKAVFLLRETFDLEIVDLQTTIYFAVFDESSNVLGETAITIEKGETITTSIDL